MNGCDPEEESMRLGAGGAAAAAAGIFPRQGGVPVAVDIYSQARKAVSERCPFETQDDSARATTNLPLKVANFLARVAGENSRRKHRKLQPKPILEVSSGEVLPRDIWAETEVYFRPVTASDIDFLMPMSVIGLNSVTGAPDKCFLNPTSCNSAEFSSIRGVCEQTTQNTQTSVLVIDSGLVDNNHVDALIDPPLPSKSIENDTADDGSVKKESVTGAGNQEELPLLEKESKGTSAKSKKKKKIKNCSLQRERVLTRSMSPYEDAKQSGASKKKPGRVRMVESSDFQELITLRTRTIPPKRSTKRKKIFDGDPNVTKLIVSHPNMSNLVDSECHVCRSGKSEESNQIVSCDSCGVKVHTKCYGVREVIQGSWLCSFCSYSRSVHGKPDDRLKAATTGSKVLPDDGHGSSSKSCVLCTNTGGALKPVEADRKESNGKKKFCHLFCSLWIPDVYVENAQMMEPIVNTKNVKENYKRLQCTLCKAKFGACVLCNFASCRVAFHPLCARKANYSMEVRRRTGSDDVELVAFCSRHSPVYDLVVARLAPTSDAEKDPLSGKFVLGSTPAAQVRKVKNGSRVKKNPMSERMLQLMLQDQLSSEQTKEDTNLCNEDCGEPRDIPGTSVEASVVDSGNFPDCEAPSIPLNTEAADLGNSTEPAMHFLRSVRRRTKNDGRIFESSSLELQSRKPTCGVLDIPNVEDPQSSSKEPKSKDLSLHHPSAEIISCEVSSDGYVVKSSSMSLVQGLPQKCATNRSALGNEDVCLSRDQNGFHLGHAHPFIREKLLKIMKGVEEDEGRTQLLASVDYSAEGSITGATHMQFEVNELEHVPDLPIDVQLDRVRRKGLLHLSPEDEIEGEILFFQNMLLESALGNKIHSDNLIFRITKDLPQELELLRRQRWDSLVVNRFLCELREFKKQGRKDKRHKEAQAILAAATAAAAASSRNSASRRETVEEAHVEVSMSHEAVPSATPSGGRIGPYSHLAPRAKENLSRLAVTRNSSERPSGHSKEHQPLCTICRGRDSTLGRVFVCSGCKVSVHLDCYQILKNSSPWYCEACEIFLKKCKGSKVLPFNTHERLDMLCGLCAQEGGAFRKCTNGQWVHVICAEWLLESTFTRGQLEAIEGMEAITKERDLHVCCICLSKSGFCIQCHHSDCENTFHPSCALEASIIMRVKVIGGTIERMAYCKMHSQEQLQKVDRKRGLEDLSAIKQIRVQLERFRILCERVSRREKLKKDMVVSSHNVLACKRDCVTVSVLVNSSLLPPEASSGSVTTSLKGYTDDNRSWSEAMQRSDDVTVDSTLSGVPSYYHSLDADARSYDRPASKKPCIRKQSDKVPQSAGKCLSNLSAASNFWSAIDDEGWRIKPRKPREILHKEVVMTPVEASMQNQRLPKGFAYVPVDCLSKDQPVSHDNDIHDSGS